MIATEDKIVFVTSTAYNGNLGGLSGADDKCNSHATAAGLPGTYTAWLCDGTTRAAGRVTQVPYDYKRVDGAVIANGWTDLTDGNLDTGIRLDENGAHPGIRAWTGTNTDASAMSNHCNNWTDGSTGFSGQQGDSNKNNSNWTMDAVPQCNTNNILYCFMN